MRLGIATNSSKPVLSVDDVIKIVESLGSEPPYYSSDGRALIFQTICHNLPHHGSRKLYYYIESNTFHCYTECGDSFDIYELIMRSLQCDFYHALLHIQGLLGIRLERKVGIVQQKVDDWNLIDKYANRIRNATNDSLKEFPASLVSYYTKAYPEEWRNDNIVPSAMDTYHIHFDVAKNEIIIPHYDINGRLIGIRSRVLDPYAVAAGFKYVPTTLEGNDFRHQLRNNLYGLYQNQETIRRTGKLVIFEAEKSVLQCEGYYGNANFTVAVCGSHVSRWQRDTILSLGVREVFLAFDKEYHEAFTQESVSYSEKILSVASMFSPYVVTYLLWDVDGLLDYKDSPSDKGKDILNTLMKNKFEVTTEND